jgi:hypothetical protein
MADRGFTSTAIVGGGGPGDAPDTATRIALLEAEVKLLKTEAAKAKTEVVEAASLRGEVEEALVTNTQLCLVPQYLYSSS